MLQLRKPWDSQPQEGTGVDWGNPLTQGLIYAVNFAEGLNPTNAARNNRGVATISGTVSRSPGSLGNAAVGSNGLISLTDPLDILRINTGPVTHIAICQISAVDSNYGGVFAVSDASGNTTFSVQRDASGPNLLLTRGNSQITASSPITVSDIIASSGWALASADSANGSAIEINTLNKAGSTTLSGSPGTQAGAGVRCVFFGERAASTSFGSDGKYYAHFAWNRFLSLAERLEVLANPWQLFAPRSIWVPVSTAGGSVTGTSATTNANDTSTASGTTTVVGTSATTNANDTATASGTVGGAVTGTSSTTNANDAAAASGTTTVTGTAAYSNANDASTASGWAGTVSGTAAVTNANDTAQASGTVVGGQSTLGGVPFSWNNTKPRETEEQKRTRRIAQGIIREAQKPAADIAKLSKKAATVSEKLRADVAYYEAEAAKYATEIAQSKQAIALVMQAKNDALATRQLEQRMIAAQLQAEAAAQQMEELDVVFMVAMLAAMED